MNGFLKICILIGWMTGLMMLMVSTGRAADTLPAWTLLSWWDFSTVMNIHIQEPGSDDYTDLTITDLDTRHSLESIETKALTHGMQSEFEVYVLPFDGLVNAEGIYHTGGVSLPVEIRNASLAGEWWVDTETLGTVYYFRDIQGPLWAQLPLFGWQQIGTIAITIHEEYEPPRDTTNFPIDVSNAWQAAFTLYSYGEYVIDAELFGEPIYQEDTFDESTGVVIDMTVPLQDLFSGYLSYRIEGADTGSAGTTLSWYAPEPRTVIYDQMANFGSSGTVQINAYTRTMSAFYLQPDATPTPSGSCIHSGDANVDGELTAGDAQRAFLIALGQFAPTYEEGCAADCNGDGEVTAGDAQAIFLAALGSGTCVDPLVK